MSHNLSLLLKRGSDCCILIVYCTAASTSLSDSLSCITFIFSECRINYCIAVASKASATRAIFPRDGNAISRNYCIAVARKKLHVQHVLRWRCKISWKVAEILKTLNILAIYLSANVAIAPCSRVAIFPLDCNAIIAENCIAIAGDKLHVHEKPWLYRSKHYHYVLTSCPHRDNEYDNENANI